LPEKNKLGEILVGAGLIDEFQLIEALGEQARFGDAWARRWSSSDS
jgi:hypothetical protein